jgi:hypothetical protein
MEEKERGLEATGLVDVEAGGTPAVEIRPSRAFSSALTQSISASTLLAVASAGVWLPFRFDCHTE